MARVLMLKTAKTDGTTFEGFQWPLEVGEVVECKDWDPKSLTSGGLFGLLLGRGDAWLLNWAADSVWIAAWVGDAEIVECVGCVKAPRAEIAYVGKCKDTLSFLAENGCDDICITGEVTVTELTKTAVAGDSCVAIAEAYAISGAGDLGIACVGAYGIASVGIGGVAMAGDHGEVRIAYNDDGITRVAIGIVGVDIDPCVFYRADETGRLVKANAE